MDAQKQETKYVADFVRECGADGLIKHLFFSNRAVRYLLQRKTKEGAKLRQSLLDIINGNDPLAQLHQSAVNARIDSIPPKAEHGFLPFAEKSNANADYQIASIKYLSPFVDTDDAVYQTCWEAARGKKSHITNVADAAIHVLARSGQNRKEQLRTTALNAREDQYVRWKAYTILAFYNLTKNRQLYDLVCDLAEDNSIGDMYAQKNEMSPNVQFWHKHELDSRSKYPEQHKDGKNEAQIKQSVVDKVQNEFREGIFEVINYMIEHRHSTDLHNDFMYPFMDERDTGKFERFDSARLTTQLCNLIRRGPSYRVQVLCRYVKLPLPKEQVEQIEATLMALKNDRLVYSSYQDWIDSTLRTIEYMRRHKRDW